MDRGAIVFDAKRSLVAFIVACVTLNVFFGVLLSGCATDASSPHSISNGDDAGSIVEKNNANEGAFGPLADSGAPSPTGIQWPTSLDCPSVPQRVLILDFRSGWWGEYEYPVPGNPAKSVLRQLATACPTVTLEYQHVLNGRVIVRCVSTISSHVCDDTPITSSDGLAAALYEPSVDAYSQLWVLSGSDGDGSATEAGSLFQTFLAQTKNSCLPVYIGVGDGAVLHGNLVATALGIDSPAKPPASNDGNGIASGVFVASATMTNSVPMGPVEVATTVAPASHPVFQGVSELADSISEGGATMEGDTLSANPGLYQIISSSAQGVPTIGIGAITLPTSAPRPFVLDAGLQRFYATHEHPPTLVFLKNIMKLLGAVGCKKNVPTPR